MTRHAWRAVMLMLLLRAGADAASVPAIAIEGPGKSRIRLEIVDRLRGEFADWFAPPPTSSTPNHRYDFLQNKFQAGVRVTADPYELFVQFQDSTLANVPEDAAGIGSAYRLNTNRSLQHGAFLRNAWVGTTRLFGVPGLFVKGGRQLYASGADAPATNPSLRWLQHWRLAQRLIGPFDYTAAGRSFDGGQVGWDGAWLNVTGFGFRPTYGGFEVDANRELDIHLGGVSLNLKDTAGAISPLMRNTLAGVYWYFYGDQRQVVFLDNRPLAVREAARGRPARLHTIGAHLARVEEIGCGVADGLVYGLGQGGDWQGEGHDAWAYGVEAGYRLPGVWAKPWMRVGINSGSGDPDPGDGRHQTFFQMLPTAWLYAQVPFHNMMNNQDVFAQWMLEPHPLVSLRADFHWLRVNAGHDLAYSGGGATKDDVFGYGGLPAGGRNELAYLVHVLLSLRPAAFLTVNALYGHAFGQGVIGANFAGNDADYGYLETVVSF